MKMSSPLLLLACFHLVAYLVGRLTLLLPGTWPLISARSTSLITGQLAVSCPHPSLHRFRPVALPTVGHRHHHQTHIGLRYPDGHTGRSVCRQHSHSASASERVHQWERSGSCRLHIGDSGPVPAHSEAHSTHHRPSLLPPQIRCRSHHRCLQRHAAWRDRLEYTERTAGGGGPGDDATYLCLVVAATAQPPGTATVWKACYYG